MNLFHCKSLSLIELIIAITLMALVVLGFASIDLFSRFQVLSSGRRAKAQNEASSVLEHMTKEISKAVGSAGISGQAPISNDTIGVDTAIHAYIDSDRDGRGDRWIAYRFISASYEIQYCPECLGNPPCDSCLSPWGSADENILSQKITYFIPNYNLSDNYIDISVTACDDPVGTCGTRDNPSVTMQTRIKMPAVSTH